MGSECWGFKPLHINGPMYRVWVLGIQPSTYEWSNVWGLSAWDSTFYIWMIQCMGSECWGFKPLHINGLMYGVWALEIQSSTYEWCNVWSLSAGDSIFYIWMVQCMGSEHWRFNLLHMNGPMYGVQTLTLKFCKLLESSLGYANSSLHMYMKFWVFMWSIFYLAWLQLRRL